MPVIFSEYYNTLLDMFYFFKKRKKKILRTKDFNHQYAKKNSKNRRNIHSNIFTIVFEIQYLFIV